MGGAVIFERGDIDEAAFIENLQRTVSDAGLLMEYLQVTTVGLLCDSYAADLSAGRTRRN